MSKKLVKKKASSVVSLAEVSAKRKRIRKDFFVGVIVAIILLLIKSQLEKTPFIEQIELLGYNQLQWQLSSRFNADDFPIQIVDISDLVAMPTPGAATPVTPRDRLFDLLKGIADQKPLVIGVDIDFSPNGFGYRDPVNDPKFFADVIGLWKDPAPKLFLGVADVCKTPHKEWLPDEYNKLAACIVVPNGDDRKMLKWIKIGASEQGPMMCAALAGERARSGSKAWWWPSWALKASRVKELSDGASAEAFLVDYSPVKTLEHDKLSTISGQSAKEEGRRFKGKIVLVGDATVSKASAGDMFPIPGRPWDIYPGIYVHACAAYTLIRDPLYELTSCGRIVLDLLLAMGVIGSVAAIRMFYARTHWTVATHRLMSVFTGIVAIAVLFGGLALVRFAGILWDDFLVVLIVLLLHPKIEKYTAAFIEWALKTMPAAWRRFIFIREGKTH
jgi:CHASE2 domain-containing sensor protein